MKSNNVIRDCFKYRIWPKNRIADSAGLVSPIIFLPVITTSLPSLPNHSNSRARDNVLDQLIEEGALQINQHSASQQKGDPQ
ncbi:Hypothetical predicted protein [Olea europaea subsp. europaea]|uniref:Uncharacterized protein n=1 Tax=Olea europaea subsp. europaea TaxID=158383 RepID=A0A8S0U2E6_OLEEU|nr:Hypothetical predicted protein [Olea europaea subsp. europaea]